MRHFSIHFLALLGVFLVPAPLLAQWQADGTYLERAQCEGEGCGIAFVAVVKTSTEVYARRGAGAVVSRLRVGDSVEVERVDIVHRRPTRVVARRRVILEPESGNPVDTLMPGDTIRILSYAGEGWHRALGDGYIRLVPEFWKDPHLLGEYPDTFPASIVTKGDYTVWYLVKYARGRRGWVRGREWFGEALEID